MLKAASVKGFRRTEIVNTLSETNEESRFLLHHAEGGSGDCRNQALALIDPLNRGFECNRDLSPTIPLSHLLTPVLLLQFLAH